VQLGTAYCLAGRFGDALSPLSAALQQQPDLTSVRYRYALALAASDRTAEARTELKQVMSDRPNGLLSEDAAAWYAAMEALSR
jgi:predicted Zn-dependent protease